MKLLRSTLPLGGLLLAAATAPALAQTTPPPPAAAAQPAQTPPVKETEVVVTGERLRGQVAGAPPPIEVLDQAAIEALGGANLQEIVAQLAAQTASVRGRGGPPVILLNGRRIGGFQEIRTLPPEALQRIEVLSEEAALQFGFSADQRVLNIILKDKFQAVEFDYDNGWAGGGGRSTDIEANFARIDRRARMTGGLEFDDTGRITQADRGIIDATGTGETQFRSLVPAIRELDAGFNINRPINETVGIGLDLRASQVTRNGLIGRGLTPGGGQTVLRQDSAVESARAGLTLDGFVGNWQWTATGVYDRSLTKTTTDVSGAAASRARADLGVADVNANINGPLLRIPAGAVRLAVRLGVQDRTLESDATRLGVTARADLGRTDSNGRITLTVPLTSRRNNVLAQLGEWSVNGNVSFNELSDFGGLVSYGGGLNWSPIDSVRFNLATDHAEAAPTINQLGDPLVVTPNVTVFDFVRGESVLVNAVSGGNRALTAEVRNDWSLGATWQVKQVPGLDLQATYAVKTAEDAISGFPSLTPDLQAAFPLRFTRDGAGRLTSIDRRALNFATRDTEQLRWGLNFQLPFGQPRRPLGAGGPPAAAGQGQPGQAQPAQGEGRPNSAGPGGGGQGGGRSMAQLMTMGPPPGAGGGGGPGGGGFGGMGGGLGAGMGAFGPPGRVSFQIFHTHTFQDEAQFAAGGPRLDLLDGDALGSSGTPADRIDMNGGLVWRGLGVRFNAAWVGESRIDGAPGGASTLFFEPYWSVNANLFFNVRARPELVKAYPWLQGVRGFVRAENLFDSAQTVRDATGATPAAFQRGFLAPQGRSVEIGLRKQF